ncbi:RING/FYVE/PHD-type zinc finger family protein [Abeliophyllum distichum]|uniref:RING/FYVE/PHD-type zinc finger family protein n=1 Tax=Abeliophyllum distichum TaxID=126358 RepID=A0ABD1UIB3_9LAMI
MDSHEEYNPLSCVHLGEDVFEANHFMSQQIVQTEESVGKLSLQSKGNENDEKVCFQSQQNKPLSCSSEMPLDETKQSKKRCSMSQDVAKTEELESLSEKVGHPTHKNGVLPCRQLAMPAENGDKQCGPSWPEKTPKNVGTQIANMEDCETESPQDTEAEIDHKRELSTSHSKQGKYFYYDSPHYEETGIWIPVSIPPMSKSEHEEWTRGFCSNGGYTPEGDSSWGQCIGEDKEMTMWDVVVEMLLVARGKVSSFASGDIGQISWISNCLIEQAWKEMAQTLTEASFSNAQEILQAEPPKWLPDSAASSCMLCSVRFHPIMCTRHHCRFCGGIFCGDCTKGRSLLPEKFRAGNLQRVCDVCCVRLETVQPYLRDQVSRAAQLPTHDMTDLSTLRSWINFPWGQTMEYEIYKATNTICCYSKVGSLGPERRIPEAILQNAKGLAILTVVKVGMMVTYNIGTGLVVARRDDGTWSAPSAISSFGVGWGAQAGGELTDFIVVLRTSDAVKTFSSDTHLSVGAGLSAAIGIIGRTAEADMRAGANGYAACYTYSCSKGAFIGCSLEGECGHNSCT